MAQDVTAAASAPARSLRASIMALQDGASSTASHLKLENETYHMPHHGSVYSYFMYVPPFKKASRLDRCMAYVLVFLALCIQGVLLYAVFNNVVMNQAHWQHGILNLGKGPLALLATLAEGNKCVETGSLCTLVGGSIIDGKITCAPPTVQLTGRWAELDKDGDGIWTYREAKSEAAHIQCKYGVDVLETFDEILQFILNREDLIWIHPKIREHKGIHQAYFTYAVGDIIMCSYRDATMCPNLLHRGVFDAPLLHGTVPRIGNTTEKALSYCYNLLRPGGVCERVLPSAYAVWKVESTEECRSPMFDKYTYRHPRTHVAKSVVEVGYEGPEEYRSVQAPLFLVYKLSLIILWLLAMVAEGKEIYLIIVWLACFPSTADEDEEIEEQEESRTTPRGSIVRKYFYQIVAVARWHRCAVGVVTLLRTVMLAVLTWVGTSLLLRNNGYVDLLFDAVSLLFVLEVASILYTNVLREELRDEIGEFIPMEVQAQASLTLLKHFPGMSDLFWLLIVCGVAGVVLYYHNAFVVKPIYQALSCACTQEGSQCLEASWFSKSFWDDYWQTETPQVFRKLDVLKKESERETEKDKAKGQATVEEDEEEPVDDATNRSKEADTRRRRTSSGKRRNKPQMLLASRDAVVLGAPEVGRWLQSSLKQLGSFSTAQGSSSTRLMQRRTRHLRQSSFAASDAV